MQLATNFLRVNKGRSKGFYFSWEEVGHWSGLKVIESRVGDLLKFVSPAVKCHVI